MEAIRADASDPLQKLATEESITLRGIISPGDPAVDLAMLDRLIAASQAALNRQLMLLRRSLDEHQRPRGTTREAAILQAKSLKRLEPLLEHAATLLHESQVLQRLRALLQEG